MYPKHFERLRWQIIGTVAESKRVTDRFNRREIMEHLLELCDAAEEREKVQAFEAEFVGGCLMAYCEYCHGSGIVVDWVPYGDTDAPLESVCECRIEEDLEDDDE